MGRRNWLPVPQAFNLDAACNIVQRAFGWGNVFLVGSATEKRDYRDVDVRCIIDDDEYEALFGRVATCHNARWTLMCASISLWLSQQSGLPVDFQIQKQSVANAENGDRIALGIFADDDGKMDG